MTSDDGESEGGGETAGWRGGRRGGGGREGGEEEGSKTGQVDAVRGDDDDDIIGFSVMKKGVLEMPKDEGFARIQVEEAYPTL